MRLGFLFIASAMAVAAQAAAQTPSDQEIADSNKFCWRAENAPRYDPKLKRPIFRPEVREACEAILEEHQRRDIEAKNKAALDNGVRSLNDITNRLKK